MLNHGMLLLVQQLICGGMCLAVLDGSWTQLWPWVLEVEGPNIAVPQRGLSDSLL